MDGFSILCEDLLERVTVDMNISISFDMASYNRWVSIHGKEAMSFLHTYKPELEKIALKHLSKNSTV